VYEIRDLSYGPFADGLLLSPRVAAPMIGLGLLETIPDDDILARADPDDADRDGISGRANRGPRPLAERDPPSAASAGSEPAIDLAADRRGVRGRHRDHELRSPATENCGDGADGLRLARAADGVRTPLRAGST
jgi:hypothetical protein